ncbi:MAG: EamA family transporter [Clostridia bacterium]|nr:EamA family transporter [Clostridia bacterium]
MNKKYLGIFYILLAGVLWGFFPIFSNVLYANGITVMQAVSARAGFAALIYLVWGVCAGTYKGLKWRDYGFFAFYGVCSILGTYIFYSLSIKYLSTAMAAILLYTAPAFVIVFNRIFYGDKITPIKIVALITTIAGSFLVVRAYDVGALVVNLPGILFGLGSGIAYSLLTVIGRAAIRRGYTAKQNTFVPAMAAGLVMTVAVPQWTLPFPSATVVLCYLAVAVIGSVLPYFFYQKGLATGIDGGVASLLANVEPVTATIFGCILLHDAIEVWQIIGILVVLAGAMLPEFAASRKLKKSVGSDRMN